MTKKIDEINPADFHSIDDIIATIKSTPEGRAAFDGAHIDLLKHKTKELRKTVSLKAERDRYKAALERITEAMQTVVDDTIFAYEEQENECVDALEQARTALGETDDI